MAKTKSKTTAPVLRRQVQDIAKDFAPHRPHKKTKVFITKDLEKKEKLSFREWLWVYNAAVIWVISFVNICIAVGFLGLSNNVTVDVVAGIWAGVAGLVFTIAAIETQRRSFGTGTLSHEKRKQQRFAERQRTKAGHALDRYGRYGRDEVEYNHFSTRVESIGRKVKLSIIEHQRTTQGKFIDQEVELKDLDQIRLLVPQAVELYEKQHGEYEQAVAIWQQQHNQWSERKRDWTKRSLRNFGRNYEMETNDLEPHSPPAPPMPTGQQAVKVLERERNETLEDFTDKVQYWKRMFDQISEAFEEQAYMRAREELEVKQLALQLRH